VVEIEGALAKIVAAPGRWPITERLASISRPSLSLHLAYREVGELIEIGAIAHHNRRPDYWVRRRP
jgi:hypothetical protein